MRGRGKRRKVGRSLASIGCEGNPRFQIVSITNSGGTILIRTAAPQVAAIASLLVSGANVVAYNTTHTVTGQPTTSTIACDSVYLADSFGGFLTILS